MKNFNEYVEEVFNDGYKEGVVETLNTVNDLHECASEVVLDALMEDGATMSEKLFAMHVLEMHYDFMNGLIVDEFEIEECDEGCCVDCELCCDCEED